ncbi:DUF881 domain-containing protein [Tessaracoccus sp. SD287]|uniref:DUF881 domain-containing protein n=1 Tax=Tessaracoccus sp. SD287 TaxID=2782008 RepID=UPI001A969DC3|nr:DUF881 domain-containing protein [Tessaracoccus sp. SD287]MBO1029762.1 DUF881 domain-containing protein [Tessaracoccus sp. SD287]
MPEKTTPTTRPGALQAFLRPSKAQFVLAVVLCLVAMATVWQFRANRADESFSSLRRDELVGLLDQLNGSNNDLREQIAEQEAAKRQLQTGADNRAQAQAQARKRVQDLSILAGTAPAEGPGITITIHDQDAKVTPQLLLDGIEEMRDAGAEVMELNGVRVVASTWLGSDRGTITVNGTPITAPYVLKVIGDPHSLEEGARFRGGLVSRLQAPEIGARVNIAQAPRILVESLHSPRPPQWARPA